MHCGTILYRTTMLYKYTTTTSELRGAAGGARSRIRGRAEATTALLLHFHTTLLKPTHTQKHDTHPSGLRGAAGGSTRLYSVYSIYYTNTRLQPPQGYEVQQAARGRAMEDERRRALQAERVRLAQAQQQRVADQRASQVRVYTTTTHYYYSVTLLYY